MTPAFPVLARKGYVDAAFASGCLLLTAAIFWPAAYASTGAPWLILPACFATCGDHRFGRRMWLVAPTLTGAVFWGAIGQWYPWLPPGSTPNEPLFAGVCAILAVGSLVRPSPR